MSSKSPARSPLERQPSSNGGMAKKSLVFGSPTAAKAAKGPETLNTEEAKQPAEENQLQAQSVTENSKTYSNADLNQEKTIKM